MKILVVDDSPVIRSKLEEVLTGAGYSVTTASDGVQALETIHDKEFDLLFLDIDMPNLSGLQVCRMLRNENQFKDFPIIMLTARDTKKDHFWGKETGATEYMTKPFDEAELLDKVKKNIEGYSRIRNMAREMREKMGGLAQEENNDVIFKAGELQETQLFKMSLINRIYQIAANQLDLNETCGRISDIFAAVIDFDIIMFLLADQDDLNLFVFVKNPITRKFFMETRKKMLNRYRELVDKPGMQWDNINVELSDPDNNMLSGEGGDAVDALKMVPLESTGDMFGMFTIARGGGKGEFSQEEEDMCGIITGQSALVINNVRMYEKIKRFAIMDGLTGLNNHRYFQEQLEKEYSRARRFNLSLSMIMLDLDHFKEINDTYGHQQGDIILKTVAIIMKRSVRDIDLVARYGGEEFAVILPETPKKNATVVAERIRASIEEHEFQLESGTIDVKASLGVSGFPDDGINTRLELVAKADEALYRAKKEGRNRVCLYVPERSRF